MNNLASLQDLLRIWSVQCILNDVNFWYCSYKSEMVLVYLHHVIEFTVLMTICSAQVIRS